MFHNVLLTICWPGSPICIITIHGPGSLNLYQTDFKHYAHYEWIANAKSNALEQYNHDLSSITM